MDSHAFTQDVPASGLARIRETARAMSIHIHLLLAVAVGLGLRLLFVFRFPFYTSGDTATYEELAHHWLARGVYGLEISGRLTPTDLRSPGYPAFLAIVHAIFGPSHLPVMVVQAFLDLASCWFIALLAANLVPAHVRARVRLAGLWLAALCPFVAIYASWGLTEVLATFITALALLVLALLVQSPTGTYVVKVAAVPLDGAFLGGFLVGLGTLVRPDTPLVLAAASFVLAWRWRHPNDWRKLLRQGLLLGLGLLIPLLPWAARNWYTLHEVQFLAPYYQELPGKFVPRGYYSWTKTWLWKARDAQVAWNPEDMSLNMSDFPTAAFDSTQERNRVASLLSEYRMTGGFTPVIDTQFAELAHERTRQHPLRTWLWIPLKRAVEMWATPRVEEFGLVFRFFPMGKAWARCPRCFLIKSLFLVLNMFFVGLALTGLWRTRWNLGVLLLVLFVLVRTAFFTQIKSVEPRYVLECIPAILALGALAWGPRSNRSRARPVM